MHALPLLHITPVSLRGPWLVAAFFLLAMPAVGAGVARAQGTSAALKPPAGEEAAPPAPVDERKAARAAAKERFEQSIGLFKKKLYGPALAEAEEARRLFPNYSSTLIIARCLKELARFDESLDMYALLVRDFEEQLKKNERDSATYKAVLREIDALRKLVGTLEIEGAEIGAMIVVNLQRRGDYPLLEPLRVPAGSHIVRVYKEGYEPFEKRVDVAGGSRKRVMASLAKLNVTGTLQVVEATGKQLEVVVDVISVGMTPWEGLLAPGVHTVSLRGDGALGTQPVTVKVERDVMTPLTLNAEELAATLRVQPKPAGATVAIDGVSVGRGLWEGKLRTGTHRVEVAAEGFVLQVRDVKLEEGKREVVVAELDRDPLSPLWKDNRGRFFVEAELGPGIVPTFGGPVGGASSAPGFGGLVMGRGGYRFPSGFVAGIDAGYVYMRQAIVDRETVVVPTGLDSNRGKADDTLSLRGFLLGASAGIRLASKMPISFRLGAGALIGSLRNHREGSFTTTLRAVETRMLPAEAYTLSFTQQHPAISVYVAPEAQLGIPLAKRLELSVGLRGLLLVTPSPPVWRPYESTIDAKTSGQATFKGEELMGRFVAFVQPGVGVRYEF
jgi:hypothetical protein